jgi:hypothetical protein
LWPQALGFNVNTKNITKTPSESLKMNGIKWNSEEKKKEDEIIMPSQREKLHKKKLTFKTISIFFLSNLLTAMLFTTCNNEGGPDVSKQISHYKIHEGYQKIQIPLQVYVSFPQNTDEIPIGLYSPSKKMIVKKAFLHPMPKDEKEASFSNMGSDGGATMDTMIEVKKEDLALIIGLKEKYLLAYPFNDAPLKSITHTEKNSYEITF